MVHKPAWIARQTGLDEAQVRQLLLEWNDTQVEFPDQCSIVDIFDRQTALTPRKTALVYPRLGSTAQGDVALTYQQLRERADVLASALKEHGVGVGALVALYMERSAELVISLLAILKAGAAYVPIDASYSAERIRFILEDARPALILVHPCLASRLPAHGVRQLTIGQEWAELGQGRASSWECEARAGDAAYVIYTSGSTGQPKGVVVEHRSISRLVMGTRYAELDETQTMLQLSSVSFDAATFEIWGALLHGARLILYPGDGVPDPRLLRSVIEEYQVTIAWLTASLFNVLVAEAPGALSGLKHLLTGGEALSVSHVREALRQLPHVRLTNGYGPTECTTFSCCYDIPKTLLEGDVSSIPIGKPISNTTVYILDARLLPVPRGTAGELYIGGPGVARGYLNRPALTNDRFLADPFSHRPGARLYRTGDLGRYLEDGNIEFLGREDDQVKIRGYRVETGEIQAALNSHPSVRDSVVVLREMQSGQKHLVAYVTMVPEDGIGPDKLLDYLRGRLAEYMVPTAIIKMDRFPLTSNGKVDKAALPLPRVDADRPTVAPSSEIERQLARIWCEILGVDRVGVDRSFFEVGGTSLLLVSLIERIRQQFDSASDLPIVSLFQYPTVRSLARHIGQRRQETTTNVRSLRGSTRAQEVRGEARPSNKRSPDSAGVDDTRSVAIVGMSGRFPGAANVEELWENLCEGKESITFFSDDEIDPSIPESTRRDPHYVRARGVISDAESFDAAFFDINPREAESMDPQHRIFLELAWEALENAGYDPGAYPGAIGLYAASGPNYYFMNNLCGREDVVENVGEFALLLANEKDFLTSRVSYKLNLRGPSVSVSTACSAALTAIAEAYFSILQGQCDMAVAGGISVQVPQKNGYLHQEGGILSRDGHCRPFDRDATGTTFNSGGGVVVLKRLREALDDRDTIYAVIKGAAINNDGSGKASFAAPGVDGQADAVMRALAMAQVSPRTVSFVEAHGTATPYGDPIEITALTKAFRSGTDDSQFCALGSIKGNIGHLVQAAGVASVIKTALALKKARIPPTINFAAPNASIDFEKTPFYVNTQPMDWVADQTPRRAGVSSFGVGGANAHVVMEEPPVIPASRMSREWKLLVISAKTEAALTASTLKLGEFLRSNPDIDLADVAYTLQGGRRRFDHRRFVVCREAADAIRSIETLDPSRVATRSTGTREPDVVFMFPGQGSQYPNMGFELYRDEPAFRQTYDMCSEILKPLLGRDLRKTVFCDRAASAMVTDELRNTLLSQPAIFATSLSLAKLYQSWGVHPSAMIGHSVGEFVCACLADVFSVEDALHLVASRAKMMQELPHGSMLSVRAPSVELEKRIGARLSIAAVNAASLCVVSGPVEAVAALKNELEAEEVPCRYLQTSHAFHSAMVEPILEPLTRLISSMHLSLPTIPFVSTVTGSWISEKEATAPTYWARHARATVQFAKGVDLLWERPELVLLELGPGTTTTTLARMQAKDPARQVAIAGLGNESADGGDWPAVMDAIGRLWLSGKSVDIKEFYAGQERRRTPLPTYPFERKRYWVDSIPASERRPDRRRPAVQPEEQMESMSLENKNEVKDARRARLAGEIREVLAQVSGRELGVPEEQTPFVEIGFDSLSLTQASIRLAKRFGVEVKFRQLVEELRTVDALAAYLDGRLPPDPEAPKELRFSPPSPAAVRGPAKGAHPQPSESERSVESSKVKVGQSAGSAVTGSSLEAIVSQQLQIMSRQLELLGDRQDSAGHPAAMTATGGVVDRAQGLAAPSTTPDRSPTASTGAPPFEKPSGSNGDGAGSRVFGAMARIERTRQSDLSTTQQTYLRSFIERYNARTARSKEYSQRHRAHMADPRVVSGFRPHIKEMVYPIVVNRSAGSKLWDIDGNRYVDLVCGFGANLFGHAPDFVKRAVCQQMKQGIEIGPQHPLAGEVAELVSELTGHERVAFCNTGSEAVMAAIRLARTVTGRDLIAVFSGSYHGTIDEMIVVGRPDRRALPAAPGIMASAVANVLVLDWDSDEALRFIQESATELAAVLVEPVQSRHPDIQPRGFLHRLREIATNGGIAFIIDEMVTGFRIAPGGAQEHFGVKADIATYGKVVGGGLPIGIVAGATRFMDALDGGQWQFGDPSVPEVGVTYFAGTFVRHPLALAAAKASLEYLKRHGGSLQSELNRRAEKLTDSLNKLFGREGIPVRMLRFGSLCRLVGLEEATHGELLPFMLRYRGVHVLEGFNYYLTTAHTDDDVDTVVDAFTAGIAELREAGFLQKRTDTSPAARAPAMTEQDSLELLQMPPEEGARLGRDPDGMPAWFVAHPEKPGEYVRIAVQPDAPSGPR